MHGEVIAAYHRLGGLIHQPQILLAHVNNAKELGRRVTMRRARIGVGEMLGSQYSHHSSWPSEAWHRRADEDNNK